MNAISRKITLTIFEVMMTTFTFHNPDDEVLIILMDGDEIGHYNHDIDGWHGISAAESLVRNIAERLGATIEVTYD